MSDRCLEIKGGRRLEGNVTVHGAKNAVLPLLAVSILTDEEVTIENCPYISDVENMCRLLGDLGAKVVRTGRRISVSGSVSGARAGTRLYKTMRSSMFMLGALLCVSGEVEMPLPGGCDIGARPLDIHLDGLRRMGARTLCDGEILNCRADKLVGAKIVMRYPSVGATENLLMCATLAKGETTLINCAREPEIVALSEGLRAMGAKIYGEGTSVIHIEGVKKLHGANLRVGGDRIVAGTVLSAVSLCGGDVSVYGVDVNDMKNVLQSFRSPHCDIDENALGFRVRSDGHTCARSVITAPFPLFPTDMQPQFLACQCFSDGVSRIQESVFENRFAHAYELMKMGANINIHGNCATVLGSSLHGADMYASDLRAGAGLGIAAMKAEGTSRIFNPHFIERGYESFADLFASVGADIKTTAL